MTRLTFLIDRVLPIGAAAIGLTQLRSAVQEGHEVSLVTTLDSSPPADLNCPVTFLTSTWPTRISRVDKEIERIASATVDAVTATDPDCVVVHNYGRFGGNYALRRLEQRHPLIVWCHDEYPYRGYHFEYRAPSGAIHRSFEPWDLGAVSATDHIGLLRRLERTALIGPSRWLADRMREVVGIAGPPVMHIANGIDLETFAPSAATGSDARIRILLVGSLIDPRKNMPAALAGVDHLARRSGAPRVEVTIAGAVPDTMVARGQRTLNGTGIGGLASQGVSVELARSLRLAGRVTSPTAMASIYADSDVVMHTSRAENFPTVCLEARAVGVPVIATDAGGSREALGPNDQLVSERATPTELADAIDTILGAEQTADDHIPSAQQMWNSLAGVVDHQLEEARDAC